MTVAVFIKSFAMPRDIETMHEARYHSWCAPGMADRLISLPGLGGRMLEPPSAEIFSELATILDGNVERIQVYDVGRPGGWLRALLAGAWKTPAVIRKGKRYLGLAAARGELRNLRAAGRRNQET